MPLDPPRINKAFSRSSKCQDFLGCWWGEAQEGRWTPFPASSLASESPAPLSLAQPTHRLQSRACFLSLAPSVLPVTQPQVPSYSGLFSFPSPPLGMPSSLPISACSNPSMFKAYLFHAAFQDPLAPPLSLISPQPFSHTYFLAGNPFFPYVTRHPSCKSP